MLADKFIIMVVASAVHYVQAQADKGGVHMIFMVQAEIFITTVLDMSMADLLI